MPDHPRTIVVGLCAHGLGIARTLYRSGIPVTALEANTDLPGVRTRCAEVRIVPDINGDGLVDALLEASPPGREVAKPVLLLTSDRMVETVGRSIDTLAPRYRLSWSHCRDRLLPLLSKANIEARCRETGLRYPASALLTDLSEAGAVLAELGFPLIVKPVRPSSPFKTRVLDSMAAFERHRALFDSNLPVLAQQFIAGDDTTIRFGAMYLSHGTPLARFEGRKLRSWPMGHTTIAVSEPNDGIHRLACSFFDGLDLSGPVSLELKRDPAGHDWVIEPTVGRTDFWAALCATNGVDLSLVEYRDAAGLPPLQAVQHGGHLWLNAERDPMAPLWLLRRDPARLLSERIHGVYIDRHDPGPAARGMARQLASFASRVCRRMGFTRPGQP